jgi:excinuclease ABC subunit B
LDLPEVSLVAILDADKEGFLRSETALIQTIGRAARNVNGKVIMYADRVTGSMERAIQETNRRRAKQTKYNLEHGIEPATIIKGIYDLTARLTGKHVMADGKGEYRAGEPRGLPKDELSRLIKEMENQMKAAAKELAFERAAMLRDQVIELRSILVEESDLPPWQKARLLAGEESS